MLGKRLPGLRRSAFGFTALELLVVLAVISLLVGLALPSLAAARRAANNSVSINHLHQLGVWAQNHTLSHRGDYAPLFFETAIVDGQLEVTIVPRSELDAGIQHLALDVFRNPLDEENRGFVKIIDSDGEENWEQMSYVFNLRLLLSGVPGMDLPDPSGTVVFTDGSMSGATMGGVNVDGVYPDTLSFMQHALRSHYYGHYNAVFADGHVAQFDYLTDEMLGPKGTLTDLLGDFEGEGPPKCAGYEADIWVDSDNMIHYGDSGGSPYGGTIHAGNGGQVIVGSSGADAIYGGNGGDIICGGGGDDVIDGGKADDVLYGGAGDDTLVGGDNGNDMMYGGSGDDFIDGGKGDDTMEGNEGNDRIEGGKGNDTIDGGPGNDILSGGDNNDTVFGGEGDDQMDGGRQNDSGDGGPGNDSAINFETVTNVP